MERLTLWDWAAGAWRAAGVEAACLRLQEDRGQCVPLLLWRAWVFAGDEDVAGGVLAEAVAIARRAQPGILAARRASPRARRAELAAERALLEALARLPTLPAPGDRDLAGAFVELSQRWGAPLALAEAADLARAVIGAAAAG